MTIDTVITDESAARHAKPIIRSRVDRATACYYPDSKRTVLVADRRDFDAAQAALTELRVYVEAALCSCQVASQCELHPGAG